MDIPVEYSGEMDGPPPHEQAHRPECIAPRYINDVMAGEIYESRVFSAPIPASRTTHREIASDHVQSLDERRGKKSMHGLRHRRLR